MGQGRKKGSTARVDWQRESTHDIAHRLGVSPFEVLLHVASNNWKALGYDSGQRVKTISEDNGPIFEDQIPIEQRVAAAKAAVKFIHPELKAVEITKGLTPDQVTKAVEITQLPAEDQIKLLEQELSRLKEAERLKNISIPQILEGIKRE